MRLNKLLGLLLVGIIFTPRLTLAEDTPDKANTPTVTPPAISINAQLLDAVNFQDVPKIKELIKSGANPSSHDDGRSILGWAAQNGNLEVVQALLDAKAETEFVDTVGHTPLIRAIETRHPAIVDALLKAKANPNFTTKEDRSALMYAVESQTPEIVRLVIKAGADVKAIAPDGNSPALIAAQDGTPTSFETIKILGEAKANLDASNIIYTPLTYAVSQDNKELVQALLDAGADPNAKTQGGQSPLQGAANNLEITQILLQAKADPNITNDRGETALFNAIANAPLEEVKVLIAAGGDVNKKDENGLSPLQLANNLYKTEFVDLLKEHGAVE